MFASKKAAALAGSLVSALSLMALAQQPGAAPRSAARPTSGPTLVVPGNIDWFEKSDVACLQDGVIDQMEFNVGDLVKKDEPIGYLHAEMAKLDVAKAQVGAGSIGAIQKAKAQRQRAVEDLAMLHNLEARRPGMITAEEKRKSEAEVLVADAMVTEATEQQNLAKAELKIAERQLEEHTIRAPFTGKITDRMRNPGEAVQKNEAVIRLGRIDKLRFFGYLPLESADQVTIGDRVEVTPVIEDAVLPIEQMKFAGNVTALSPEISTVNRTEIQVLAEINVPPDEDNPRGIGTKPMAGMKGEMTIYLRTAGAGAPDQTAAAGTSAPLPGVGTPR